MDPVLRLNVGGASFSLSRDLLERYPKTRLGQIACADAFESSLAFCDGYLTNTEELYFDRSQVAFDLIINLYRNDVIHITETWCPNSFLKELDYWQIEPESLAPCCFKKVEPFLNDRSRNPLDILREQMSSVHDKKVFGRRAAVFEHDCEFLNQRFGRLRKKVWIFLENPASSRPAMIFSIVSLVVIAATVILLILSSFKQFQEVDPITNSTLKLDIIDIGDTFCVAFFTGEYLLRLWSSPNTLEFVRNPMSIIDVAAVLPFYLELAFKVIGVDTNFALNDFKRSMTLVRMLRILRLLRVLRVLKVARYSQGFQSMASTLSKSYKELVLLIMFMTTANILFSTLMYFLESEEPNTKFRSIPDAAWWCVITMTTVGYGDIFPTSTAGKILAGIVSVSGVILLAFPISVIVENFNQVYNPEDAQNAQ